MRTHLGGSDQVEGGGSGIFQVTGLGGRSIGSLLYQKDVAHFTADKWEKILG